ncbi:MAG: lipoprotein [Burkholderiales bacterium]|nr:lipoprotein [Burkholderiales bacterium]
MPNACRPSVVRPTVALRLAGLALGLLALAGCGQKGPLQLPAAGATPPPLAPASAASAAR